MRVVKKNGKRRRPPTLAIGPSPYTTVRRAGWTSAAFGLTMPSSLRLMERRRQRYAAMKKRVAVVGATGIAGQQFLVALDRHPWFDVVKLAASERSAGKTYGAAIRDAKSGARRWRCPEEPPAG